MNERRPVTDLVQEIVQGVIAVGALMGGLAITILGLVTGRQSTGVPDWLSLLIGAIIAFYFSRSGQQQMVTALTNGPLHTIADLAQQPPRQVRATDVPTPDTEAA